MTKKELKNNKQLLMIFIMDFIFLFTHISLLIFFACIQAAIMVFANILSVTCYAVLLALIKTGKISHGKATWITITEIWIHLTLAVLCFGWPSGFQLYCIGVISILFFSSYGNGIDGLNDTHPLAASFISMVIFFGLEIYTAKEIPLYYMSPLMLKGIYTANVMLIFAMLILFSKVYTDFIKMTEQRIELAADLDELTHLFNRRKMREFLGFFHETALKTDTKYYISMFDIDDFKKINDTYGHDAGDYVLVTIGKILISHANDYAKVCRWGGEEFLFIESYVKDPCGCADRIEDIRVDIEHYPFVYKDASFHLTVTAGSASSAPDLSIARVIAKADENLYIGKGSGKNKVVS